MHRSVLTADPDALHLAVTHPSDGRALRHHVDDLMLSWIGDLSAAIAELSGFGAMTRHFSADLLQMHVEEALYRELLDVGRGIVRRRYLALAGAPSLRPVQCPSLLFELVASHWPDATVPLEKHSPFSGSAGILRRVRELARHARRLHEGARRAHARPERVSTRQSVIAVELAEGSDPGAKADAFWLADGAVDPARVLFVLEAHNRAYLDVERELRTISQLGARAIAMHSSVSASGEIPVWIAPLQDASSGAWRHDLPPAASPTEKWLRGQLLAFGKRVWHWESFFRQHNVAIYQHFTEVWSDLAARRSAIDRVGGLEVGRMRSEFFEKSAAAFHFQHEIALVWHGNVRPNLEHSRTRTREIVPTGYTGDFLRERKRAAAQELRSGLERAGARVVVAVYDNYPHPIGHFDQAQVESFYALLVRLAEDDPRVGLIVKSKKPHILKMMPGVAATLGKLVSSGRCVLLTAPFTSIVPSALAADIAVGIPASTAVCEAALCGCRMLMYDPSGSSGHPIADPRRGVVHGHLVSFRDALARQVAGVLAGESAQDHALLDDLDPFRDGLAHARAAAYLNGFLASHDAGRGKIEALSQAQRAYQEVADRPAARSAI